jgi:hypothetical protein
MAYRRGPTVEEQIMLDFIIDLRNMQKNKDVDLILKKLLHGVAQVIIIKTSKTKKYKAEMLQNPLLDGWLKSVKQILEINEILWFNIVKEKQENSYINNYEALCNYVLHSKEKQLDREKEQQAINDLKKRELSDLEILRSTYKQLEKELIDTMSDDEKKHWIKLKIAKKKARHIEFNESKESKEIYNELPIIQYQIEKAKRKAEHLTFIITMKKERNEDEQKCKEQQKRMIIIQNTEDDEEDDEDDDEQKRIEEFFKQQHRVEQMFNLENTEDEQSLIKDFFEHHHRFEQMFQNIEGESEHIRKVRELCEQQKQDILQQQNFLDREHKRIKDLLEKQKQEENDFMNYFNFEEELFNSNRQNNVFIGTGAGTNAGGAGAGDAGAGEARAGVEEARAGAGAGAGAGGA